MARNRISSIPRRVAGLGQPGRNRECRMGDLHALNHPHRHLCVDTGLGEHRRYRRRHLDDWGNARSGCLRPRLQRQRDQPAPAGPQGTVGRPPGASTSGRRRMPQSGASHGDVNGDCAGDCCGDTTGPVQEVVDSPKPRHIDGQPSLRLICPRGGKHCVLKVGLNQGDRHPTS